MGISCMGYLLALDAKRIMDSNSMAVLQSSSSCKAQKLVDRQAFCHSGDYRVCDCNVHIPGRQLVDEEFSYILKVYKESGVTDNKK